MPSATDVGAHERPELQQHPLDVVRVHEVGGQPADHDVRVETEECGAGRAGVGDPTVGVDDERGVGRVLDEGAEAVLAVARRRLRVLLLLPRGTRHADDEPEHERAHDAERERVPGGQERRHPVLRDRDLPDRDSHQAPTQGDPPGARAVEREVLERHERIGADEHRAPAREVDDDGHRGAVQRDARVQSGRGGPPSVREVGDDAQGRHGDEHGDPHPGGLVGDETVRTEHEDEGEGRRSHQVPEQIGAEAVLAFGCRRRRARVASPDAGASSVGRGGIANLGRGRETPIRGCFVPGSRSLEMPGRRAADPAPETGRSGPADDRTEPV